jgi:diguanylate cyclase (GGDEF)-like protein
MSLSKLRHFLTRHRVTIRDLSIILVGTLLALWYAYEVDIFPNEGNVTHEATIELDEALLIGALVILALLIFGVKQYLGQKREIAKRNAAERRIRELAYQDGLTGLPNRRQFDEALKAAVASPPRAGASHGVFLLDLNGFKQINDVHGHGVGDEALTIVGQRLRSAMRDGDMVARFGGDEFAVLALHLAGPESATTLALRVIDSLATPIAAGGAIHRIGVGIGIALVPLGALRGAGVRIALDNFGTGYSSLYHLRNLKIDKIKIDRSFIHTMAKESASAGIVNALVGFGHGFGLTIAADGVEAIDQEASLLGSGCEEGQGEFFSVPVNAAQTLSLFASDATASLRVDFRK